ncbi:magnesium transporter [Pseudonocardia autotrophica]|uniref:Magnesium transport protein CorA n=2 Tax=Pseudonocardia TaxID=1847 RepID=A0A1Y2MQI3_PSEAH|nr:Magnesium transport protein CorA [Pseudonocardia autotrophica]TDN77205.1 magnesium transporter [Pseudonocardia autotrophica]BBG01221.1 magnesium transporter CorA [Pseudonocardia autotrophica]GEC29596.1 magnesium transporter CorA [Pseudonocardia saturnea]
MVAIIDNAVYGAGKRLTQPQSLADTYRLLNDCDGRLAWIGLYRPEQDEFTSLAKEFDLHPLAVEDAVQAHQRPKLERYGDTLFVVLRAARYLDAVEEVKFGEVHVFVGPDFVLTVRHGEAPDLHGVRTRMEQDPALLRQRPEAVLYAILDRVVDDYAPVVNGLETDIEEIETQVFARVPEVSQRIYELSRQVVEFQRAARPLAAVLNGLSAGFGKYGTNEELQRNLRDVQDHLVQVIERLDGFRQFLQAVLSVNATLVAQQQNEEMKNLTEAALAQNSEMKVLTEAALAQNLEVKKISAWAAILFAPTLIGTIYGMNFDHMPELSWAVGYPFALTLMVLTCAGLFWSFRRRDWL